MKWFKSFWHGLTAPQPGRQISSPGKITVRLQPPAASTENLSKFTPRAQKSLALARAEARRLHHNFVGTEHLLLGMVALGQGAAIASLKRLGLDLESLRLEVEKVVGLGPDQAVPENIPYTPRIKKVLALAIKEAQVLNHTYVGTEHLLLGLLREGDGIGGRVLKHFNLDLEKMRQEIMKELDPNARPADPAAGGSSQTAAALPSKTQTSPLATASKVRREPVDTSKRYDVYCSGRGEGVVIYRNALFKTVKTLFQRHDNDVLSDYVELEQSDGQIIFVARSTIIRFCDPGAAPPSENVSDQKT